MESKSVVLKQTTIDFILCMILAVIFSLSVLFSYLFIKYDYSPSVAAETNNRSITIPYDGLIEGNSSGNIAQYIMTESKNREGFGSFCVKSKYMYYSKEDRNKTYLIKASVADPASEYPILEGYSAEYINVVGSKLFFIGRPAGTFDWKRIYTMDLEGGNMSAFDLNVSNSIVSLATNSNYLYFTVEGDPTIYSVSLSGEKMERLASFSDSEKGLRLFGIDKSHIYFVNDSYMGKVDFSTGEKTRLTNDCFSIYQSPILTSNGVMFYSSLSNTDYMFVSKAGGPASKLYNTTQIQSLLGTESPVRYVNFDSDYLFLTVGQNIYYTPFGSAELKPLRGITLSENGRAFFGSDYCIAETDEGIRSININWLLSQ